MIHRLSPARALGASCAGLALFLAACASDEPDGPPHRRGDGPPPPHASLFISPSGQPFRAAPGEPYPVAAWFAQADRNGDGRIDRAEFRADAAAFFKLLDKNGDGVIDGFEVSAYEHDVAPEILGAYRSAGRDGEGGRPPHPGGHGPGGGGPRGGDGAGFGAGGAEVMGGATPYELISEPEPVASADRGMTGHITLAAFLAAEDRRFDLLDTKGLGYLTLADLPKTPVQLEAEGPAARRKGAR
ncbi:MAG: EF-hand domain-containing protein [Caulobacteraceae bacterium]|nr:EF-hand domain-containing protein [Caulobacteraceae bacterium]